MLFSSHPSHTDKVDYGVQNKSVNFQKYPLTYKGQYQPQPWLNFDSAQLFVIWSIK